MSVQRQETLIIPQISDKTAFPDFSKPEIIGCFSLDAHRQFIDGPKYLKYLRIPESEQCVEFNLDNGCSETSIEDEEETLKQTSELVQLLQWINLHAQTFQKRRPHFVLYRGLLSKILGTPYEDKEGWTLAALWKNGTIYLRNLETPESQRSRAQYNANPRLRRIAAWGRRFEQYVLSDDPFGKPDPVTPSKEECNLVYLSKLNNHRILYAAELDGIWSKDGNDIDPKKHPEKLSQCHLVELKTTRLFPHGAMTKNFKRFNLRKWWCQSFTAKISDVVVGLRDDEGVVTELQVMPLNTLPKLGQGWLGTVCFNFLDNFLTQVKNTVKEDPETVYVFTYNPLHQRNMDCKISVVAETNSSKLLPNLL